MGMFDDLLCEAPLPETPAPPNVALFQTKSLPDPRMRTFIIKRDGRLVHLMDDGEKIEIEHHGDIYFHELDSETNEWWEYVARFTEGRLSRIWCDHHRPSRAARQEEAQG